MLTITGPAAAPLAARIAPTHVSLAAAAADWDGFWRFDEVNTTRSGLSILSAADLSGNGNEAAQTDGTTRCPTIVTDDETGQRVARFAADRSDFLRIDNQLDARSTFTLFAVVKTDVADLTILNTSVIGSYAASAPDRAFINAAQGGTYAAFMGDDGDVNAPFPNAPIPSRRWSLVVMSYDGSGGAPDSLKLRVDGGPWRGGTITVEPTGPTDLWIGYSASGFATYVGDMAMAGVASFDISAPANASRLLSLQRAVRSVMGTALPPLIRPAA